MTGALFDAVLMLTWSDWKTEPRSNRYHYATRFAKQVPVFFFQLNWLHPKISVEPSGVENIEIVRVQPQLNAGMVQQCLAFLRERAIHRPLIWIYNSHDYDLLIDALPKALRVYHATEDYLTKGSLYSYDWQKLSDGIERLLPRIDLLVGVSEGVIDSYRVRAGYEGKAVLAANGCDAEFFFGIRQSTQRLNQKIAIYQGGINARLDFDLLLALAQKMPDWQFWFCGVEVAEIKAWKTLKALPNVTYFGALSPAEFAIKMCEATVGLIPFQNEEVIQRSLPLKAFEYVACGLPVVTVPIDALNAYPDVFRTAASANAFAQAMEAVAHLPAQEAFQRRCTEVAAANTYDQRFADVMQAIAETYENKPLLKHRLNVAFLYDDRSMHVNTVREHALAFQRYSVHQICYIPATGGSGDALLEGISLDFYDVLIVHYSVRISLPDHLSALMAQQISAFSGLKILFVQDEYDATETARQWMDRLAFDIVYTCVPKAYVEQVYPAARYPHTEFLPTLTGYVPEDGQGRFHVKPMARRELRIGYRGRRLSPIYGMLGYEKFRIGEEMKAIAQRFGVPVDIETDDAKRIYGADWYAFLGSVRATLGTESGSNLFDEQGTLQAEIDRVLQAHPEWDFPALHAAMLAEREGRIRMNQVSPKIFEAIQMRTALVLFEGDYSGVVKPDIHFIPLAKDFSNAAEVFAKLEDVAYLEALTERAYQDVIVSGNYSYRQFVAGVDGDIACRLHHPPRCSLYMAPLFAVNSRHERVMVAPRQALVGTHLVGRGVSRETLAHEHRRARSQYTAGGIRGFSLSLGSFVPQRMSDWLAGLMVGLLNCAQKKSDPHVLFRLIRGIYRLFPTQMRLRVLWWVRNTLRLG